MHGQGIASALWSAVRRLASVPGGIRATIAAVAAAAAFAGAVPEASATPVEYDYTGTDFTSVTGVYTNADNVTGDVIFNGPLTPSAANNFTFPNNAPLPFAFTLSDGVNTISSGDTGLSFPSGATFVTNAADQIVSANFGVTEQNGSPPNAQSKGIAIFPTGSRGESGTSNGSGIGQSLTAGTWSGPIVSPPPPSCSSIINNSVPKPVGGGTSITATFTPQVFGLSLQQAAIDCGFVAFDWQQTVTSWPTPSALFQFGNPVALKAPPSFNDYPPGGYVYCHFTNCATRYPFYYDPATLTTGCALRNGPLCITPVETGPVLNFFDAPADACLANSDGTPSNAWLNASGNTPNVKSDCSDTIAPAGSQLGFKTDLAGILSTFVPGTDCISLMTCIDLGIGFSSGLLNALYL